MEGVETEDAHKFTLANLYTGAELDDTYSNNSRSQRSDKGYESKKSQHIFNMLLESNKK